MAEIEFGVFDWVDLGSGPLQQLYEERLRLVEEADRLGFFCYHFAEHHATTLGMAPSPGLMIAAASQRTKRIRLGPLGVLLPLYSPLRLIEDICVLDHMSGGRLELGIGRGVSPYELGYHGVDPEQSRAMFGEALDILVAGMTEERLTYHGQYYRYDDVPMELHPLQQPYPPLWYPTSNPNSVRWAAEHGMNLMGLGPAAAFAQAVAQYREVWQEHADDPRRLNPTNRDPKVGINRQIYVAETDAQAVAEARTAHQQFGQSFTKLWHAFGNHNLDRNRDFDSAVAQETIYVGSPARVAEMIDRMFDVTGCNYVTLAFAWGTLSLEQSLRSMRLFAEEVMPALTRERRASPA